MKKIVTYIVVHKIEISILRSSKCVKVSSLIITKISSHIVVLPKKEFRKKYINNIVHTKVGHLMHFCFIRVISKWILVHIMIEMGCLEDEWFNVAMTWCVWCSASNAIYKYIKLWSRNYIISHVWKPENYRQKDSFLKSFAMKHYSHWS